MQIPDMTENAISQVPALHVLQNMGWHYLTPDEALNLRGDRLANVILDGILAPWLREHNRIHHKGQEVPFAEGNILSAMQALKETPLDGLVRSNEQVYDLLCLGKSMQQSVDGDIKSFTLRYVDWENPENNIYHVTEEFVVERTGSRETYRPDIVLFVNGIPFSVIECKSPARKEPMTEAISQHLRNQKDEGIPKLFLTVQLLLAISKNDAKYGTVGTPSKFWAGWREQEEEKKAEGKGEDGFWRLPEWKGLIGEALLQQVVNQELTESEIDSIHASGMLSTQESSESYGKISRQITEQDRLLFALCRPERLLELCYRYVLFDAGVKKVARYQQYFCVRKLMTRIASRDQDGRRNGGVVWHTQGSGKSLTMVLLAKSIALSNILDYKIVLVTDRVDLDEQLFRTFYHCGKEVEQARTGKNLLEMLQGTRQRIITTVIDKFEAAVGRAGERNESSDIFVLVDEGHRGQYGPRHAKMRRVLPNACYIGFTGTPVMKKDKDKI